MNSKSVNHVTYRKNFVIYICPAFKTFVPEYYAPENLKTFTQLYNRPYSLPTKKWNRIIRKPHFQDIQKLKEFKI